MLFIELFLLFFDDAVSACIPNETQRNVNWVLVSVILAQKTFVCFKTDFEVIRSQISAHRRHTTMRVRGAARHLPLCQNPVTNAKRLFTDAAADTNWVLPIRRRNRHRRRCRRRYSHITDVAAVDWWRCWRCKLSLFTALPVHYRNNFTFMNTSGQRPN